MQENMSKYLPALIFMLIPLLALIFRGLFYDRKKFYVDYVVFTLHTQSLYFLFMLAVFLLGLIYKIPYLQSISMLLFFIHTLLAAKQVFIKTYTGTTLRLLGSLGIYIVALGIAFILLSVFVLFVIVT